MGQILDLATIKIELKMNGSFLAKVTLNWQDEFEVRYCRITKKSDGGLWFQPPSLKDYGYVKCFVALDRTDWNKLAKRVITAFIEELKTKVNEGVYPISVLKKIEETQETISDEDLEKIDNEINKQIITYKNQ